MSMMTESETLYEDIAPLLRHDGIRLVELCVSRRKTSVHVKAVIFCPEGTGIDECSRAHKRIQLKLDDLFGADNVYLETMSPGLGRVIAHPREYALFAGRRVTVCLVSEEVITGTIMSADGEMLCVSDNENEHVIPLADIRKAKLNDTLGGRHD